MGFGRFALSAAGKIAIVLAVIAAFVFGMFATVYLSLRTSEVKVPDVLGKDRLTAENMLDEAGLKLRVRGARPSAERPDTVLSQLPEAGQVVKAGIPVAVEISRPPKEGESVPVKEEPKQEAEKPAENSNSNQSPTATNTNQNQNRSQRNRNRNANNANNANGRNANNANANRGPNANRNANANANTPRNANGNRNANAAPNANRTPSNQNANRRAPAATPPPARPAATATP